MLELNKIYNLPCEIGLKQLDNESIDLTVTSPPYDDLRNYKGFSFPFETIANELYRVTKNGGIVVWVVGDATVEGSETGTSFKQALYFMQIGFKLHDTMIYEKNGFSNPSNNRYHQVFEYMFIFAKEKPKCFNPIKDKPNKWLTWGKNTSRQKNGELIEKQKNHDYINNDGMRFNIWKYNCGGLGMSSKDEIAYEHPAIFPENLAADHVKSWSNENEIVLDPFMGSGTTAKVAMKLNRKFIGFEISKEYHELAEKRVNMNVDLFTSF